MKFEKGKWYKTSEGFEVELLISVEKDGMYNVFRHSAGHGYDPYYPDKDGKTDYGSRIVSEDKTE